MEVVGTFGAHIARPSVGRRGQHSAVHGAARQPSPAIVTGCLIAHGFGAARSQPSAEASPVWR